MTAIHSNDDELVVLYVEDDELTRQSVGNRLRRRGIRVLMAESGEKALDLIEDRPPVSAVLLDLGLPGIDGLQTYARLQEVHPDVPVVICSGVMSSGVTVRMRRMGISEECCLLKPVRSKYSAELKVVVLGQFTDVLWTPFSAN